MSQGFCPSGPTANGFMECAPANLPDKFAGRPSRPSDSARNAYRLQTYTEKDRLTGWASLPVGKTSAGKPRFEDGPFPNPWPRNRAAKTGTQSSPPLSASGSACQYLSDKLFPRVSHRLSSTLRHPGKESGGTRKGVLRDSRRDTTPALNMERMGRMNRYVRGKRLLHP